MFLDELAPFLQELTRQPVAFVGGFVSSVLRLDLSDDPVKSWLDNQDVAVSDGDEAASSNGSSSGPQKISID